MTNPPFPPLAYYSHLDPETAIGIATGRFNPHTLEPMEPEVPALAMEDEWLPGDGGEGENGGGVGKENVTPQLLQVYIGVERI